MPLDEATRSRIQSIIAADRAVLFMKGTRETPQCGFSATVVGILDRLIPSYTTVNVLADPALREGIKEFSSWPTIPQLYVAGEFVGGCDIIQESFASGELSQTLGVADGEAQTPAVTLTDAAVEALRGLESQAAGRDLHLQIDARFRSGLYFGPSEPGELRVESKGITLCLDPITARRADGVCLDVEQTAEGPAFRIDNPNAPKVRAMSVQELQTKLAAGEALELFDVRTPEEHARARLEAARFHDAEAARHIESLDRDTLLVFHCHHGGRSQQAAEHYAALGFRNVWNLEGGIDAWSREVDPAVPRY